MQKELLCYKSEWKCQCCKI